MTSCEWCGAGLDRKKAGARFCKDAHRKAARRASQRAQLGCIECAECHEPLPDYVEVWGRLARRLESGRHRRIGSLYCSDRCRQWACRRQAELEGFRALVEIMKATTSS